MNNPLLYSIAVLAVVAILATAKGCLYINDARDRQIGRFSSQTVADYTPAKGCE